MRDERFVDITKGLSLRNIASFGRDQHVGYTCRNEGGEPYDNADHRP